MSDFRRACRFRLVLSAVLRAKMNAVSPESAHLLDLPAGMPVLRIERVAYTFDRKPAEFRISVVDTRDVDYVSRMRDAA